MNLAQKIKNSKKYRSIYVKTIERIAKDCVLRYGEKEAEKKAKNILHQIWGAYYSARPNFNKILNSFKENTDIKNEESVKENILPLLKIHSSTKERNPELNEFYAKIFEITGVPNSIIDHGCGFNPLAIIYAGALKEIKYSAYDIDEDEINFLRQIFGFLGIKNIRADLGDVLVDSFESADIVFMLKLLPVLDSQKKGAVPDLIKAQKCKYVVVSFPVKSLGGREKGMADFYTSQFEKIIVNEGFKAEKIKLKSEIVFIVKK